MEFLQEMGQNKPQIFARQATGLVRALTPLDAFIIAVGIADIPFGGAAGYGFFGFLYPGADPAFTFLAALMPGILVAMIYIYFAVAMPRSGGDYVFLSRTVSPAFGFMMNFSITLLTFFAVGLDCYYLSTLMLAPGLGAMGISLKNQSLINLATRLTTPDTAFVVGVVVVAFMTAMLALRVQLISKVNRVLFIVSMIGVIVVFALLATTSNSAFISLFNQKLAGQANYTGILQTAKTNGWKPTATMLLPTLLAAAPAFVFLGQGPTYPVYVAGEIKSIKRAIPIALIGGFFFAGFVDFIGGELIMHSVGYNFNAAAGYLYFGTTSYPLTIPPWINFYAGLMTNNVVLLSIIAVYIAAAMVLNMLAFLLTATRSMFAWSFDRVVPDALTKISTRTNSPYILALISGAGSLVALWFAAFTPYLSFYLNGTIWFAGALLLVAIAGIIYPFRRKDIYEKSPWKVSIGGLPLVSLLSVIAAIFLVFLIYAASVTPAIGPTSFGSYGIIFASFLIPLAIYAVAKYYRKSKNGVDLAMLYNEIPPE